MKDTDIDTNWKLSNIPSHHDLADVEQCLYGAMAVARLYSMARTDALSEEEEDQLCGMDHGGVMYALIALTTAGWLKLAEWKDRQEKARNANVAG